MFGWLRPDPRKALQKRYEALMKEAQALQRKGDIPAFAIKDAEARAVYAEIEKLDAKTG